MPQLDSCHPQVVSALEKAGWRVTPKPVRLDTPVNTLFADIFASRPVELGDQEIIVVEAKCFPEGSARMEELYTSIGQYLIYRDLLPKQGITSPIYLAIPLTVYEGFFEALAMPIVTEVGIKLVVIDLEQEEIVQWME